MELPDYLPLSYLNQLVYCSRRFWLMFYQSEIEINAPMLEGTLRHERAHQPGEEKDESGRIMRSVHVWSDTLRVSGIADFVEEHNGLLIPVEYKHGRMGQWINDHVQLCAQAICLEERMNTVVPTGEIFYWANRRRERVEFDKALREHTVAVITEAFDLLARGLIPSPIDHAAKCRDCSMEPICLPKETLKLLKEDRL